MPRRVNRPRPKSDGNLSAMDAITFELLALVKKLMDNKEALVPARLGNSFKEVCRDLHIKFYYGAIVRDTLNPETISGQYFYID